MFISSWFPWRLSRQHKSRSQPPHSPGLRRRGTRLAVEQLEDRTVPSTLIVLNNLDSGAGSLRDTIKHASSGDLIKFDSSLNGQTITLTSDELAISKNLDIEGPGADKLAISGNNQSRIFDVSQNQKTVAVTIAGLTIENGLNSSAALGGGIFNKSSTLNLTNDVLSNNVALSHSTGTPAEGGAIYIWRGVLTVTGCTFTGNQALGSDGGTKGEGGAILNREATATITHSTFTNNLGRGGDGATGIQSSGGNYGAGRGGAICTTGQMTIEDCTLDSNQAIGGNNAAPGSTMAIGVGGAIESLSGTLTVRNTTITNNRATGGTTTIGPAGAGVGGGLCTDGPTSVIMDNCTISGNTATGGPGGGGANGGGLFLGFSSTASVTYSTFSDNQAIASAGKVGVAGGYAYGGGITVGFFLGDNSTLSLGHCTITGNLARGGDGGAGGNGGNGLGGGIGNFGGSSLTLSGCTLSGNQATGGAGGSGANGGNGFGGGVYNDGQSTLTITAGTIGSMNQAAGGAAGSGGVTGLSEGGGVYNFGTIFIDAVTVIFGNKADFFPDCFGC